MRDTKCGSCQEFCILSPDTVGHGRDGQQQVRAGAGLWATSYWFLSGLALYSNTVTKGTGHSELIGGTLHIPTILSNLQSLIILQCRFQLPIPTASFCLVISYHKVLHVSSRQLKIKTECCQEFCLNPLTNKNSFPVSPKFGSCRIYIKTSFNRAEFWASSCLLSFYQRLEPSPSTNLGVLL